MKVSILIPVYNASQHLRETIDSALKLNWDNKEIIIIDDGSQDNSFEIARSYKSQYIKAYQIPNGGAAAARNYAFEKCSGEFIQYLDADDQLHPNKLNIQLSKDTEKKGKLMACNWKELNAVNPTIELDQFQEINAVNLLLYMWNNGKMIQTSCWLAHRSLIEKSGGWDTSLKQNPNDDGEFFCRIALAAKSVMFNESELVYYRKPIDKVNSVSQNSSKTAISSLLKSYISYEKNILPIRDTLEVREALVKNYSSFIYQNYNNHKDLSITALERIKALGLNKCKQPINTHFGMMERLFGFKISASIRKYFKGL